MCIRKHPPVGLGAFLRKAYLQLNIWLFILDAGYLMLDITS